MTYVASIFLYLSLCSVLIPIVAFLTGKEKTRITVIIFILLCNSLAADIGNEVNQRLQNRTAFIDNFYLFIQFIIVSLLFFQLCKQVNKLIYGLSIGFIVLLNLNIFYLQPLSQFQSNMAIVQNIIFIVYTFTFFIQLIRELNVIHLLKYAPFWMVTAIFFYSLISLYVFALSSYIINSLPKEYADALWIFHDFCNILKNILFTFGMYYAGRRGSAILDNTSEIDLAGKIDLNH